MSGDRHGGFNVLGIGAAACVACCAGPILAVLGGSTVAGVASTVVIGVAGLAIAGAASAALTFAAVGRRRRHCGTPDEPEPVLLAPPRRSPARPRTGADA